MINQLIGNPENKSFYEKIFDNNHNNITGRDIDLDYEEPSSSCELRLDYRD